MAQPVALIEFRGVSKAYGEKLAVRDLTLSISEGEFFALLGPSGCGKSTTLGMIAGFLEPDQGEIYLGGKSTRGVPAHRRSVNTVFQNYALFPHMTVAENVGFGLRMRRVPPGEIRRRVGEVLEIVGLAGFDERKPAQLSGGEQQRTALARALVNQPSVLLLDEPLGALDLKLRRQMQLELTRIQRRFGITFVYVTHDQEEAMSMAHRIAVMDRTGRMVQAGTPQEIYCRPKNRFVADFTGAANFFTGVVTGKAEEGAVLIECEPGVTILAGSGAAQRGKRVQLTVRPERMALAGKLGNGKDNWLAGEVIQASFLGSDIRYVVRTQGGDLVVKNPLRGGPVLRREFEEGQSVFVHWMAGDTLVVEE